MVAVQHWIVCEALLRATVNQVKSDPLGHAVSDD
jgi:hypothetical protein